VSFVFRGPTERKLGEWGTLPTGRLEAVYNESGYVVYRVEPADD